MDHAKRPGARLFVISALAFIVAIGAGAYAYWRIGQLGTQCIAHTSERCRDFVPWMWVCLGMVFAGTAALLLAFTKRRNWAVWPVLLLIAVLLVGMGWLAWRSQANPSRTNDAQQRVSSGEDAEITSRIAQAKAQSGAGQAQPGAAHPFPELPRSRAGLPLNDDPFLATSKEEQSWLDRNGYPNVKQWAAYGRASDSLLEQAAAAGDKAARIMLDQRKLMAGDDTKIEALLTEGAKGSAFALDMLAAYLANGDSGGRVTAYAVSRVSEMRGNIRLGPARDAMFNKPLSPSDRMEGEKEAFEIYNSLYELQKSIAGPSSKPVDPRPIGG